MRKKERRGGESSVLTEKKMRCVASTMQTNAGAKETTKFQGVDLCRPMMYLWDRHAETGKTGWCFFAGELEPVKYRGTGRFTYHEWGN